MSDYAEYLAQCVERREDNPENWPTLSELPEADVSDILQTYRLTVDETE